MSLLSTLTQVRADETKHPGFSLLDRVKEATGLDPRSRKGDTTAYQQARQFLKICRRAGQRRDVLGAALEALLPRP